MCLWINNCSVLCSCANSVLLAHSKMRKRNKSCHSKVNQRNGVINTIVGFKNKINNNYGCSTIRLLCSDGIFIHKYCKEPLYIHNEVIIMKYVVSWSHCAGIYSIWSPCIGSFTWTNYVIISLTYECIRRNRLSIEKITQLQLNSENDVHSTEFKFCNQLQW